MGIDRSCVAIAAADMALPANEREFWVADFAATAIGHAMAHAVVSLDALYLAPEPARALCEVQRILAPKGSLLFTVLFEPARLSRQITPIGVHRTGGDGYGRLGWR